MSDTGQPLTTAEQLAALTVDGTRYELVEGALHMMSPAGADHGRIGATLLILIGQHVRQYGLGRTFTAETGFLIGQNPDTVLAPDLAFVADARLVNFTRFTGYLPLAPDLIAEVVARSDRSGEVEAKITRWLLAGVRVALVVECDAHTVRAYRPHGPVQRSTDRPLDLRDVLPGFQLDVVELFC